MHTNLIKNRAITPLQTVIAMAATVVAAILSLLSCGGEKEEKEQLFDPGCYPYAVRHGDNYYFIRQADNTKNITITTTTDLTRVADGKSKQVWPLGGKKADTDIWSPELHYIKGKWYIYFEADDGNTDNHEIYVLENTAATPTEGTFRLKGAVRTNAEWNFGIHPTTFTVGGRQYLVWSGWPKRRSDAETQCIYIAAMSNPWTVSSDRVLISQPTYEWERQWINPDGTRSAYPIYVNENPTVTMSRDGSRVIVYYSASGCWTPYRCEGIQYILFFRQLFVFFLSVLCAFFCFCNKGIQAFFMWKSRGDLLLANRADVAYVQFHANAFCPFIDTFTLLFINLLGGILGDFCIM